MNKNTPQLESFDSFFAGLAMKDEKNAIKLYEKYILDWHSSSIKEILEGLIESEKEKIREAEILNINGDNSLVLASMRVAKSDTINHLESIIKQLKEEE